MKQSIELRYRVQLIDENDTVVEEETHDTSEKAEKAEEALGRLYAHKLRIVKESELAEEMERWEEDTQRIDELIAIGGR